MSPAQLNTFWSLISDWKEAPAGKEALEAGREIDAYVSALFAQVDEVIAHGDIDDKYLCGIHRVWRDEAVARHEARVSDKARST